MHGGRVAYYVLGEGVVPESPASAAGGTPTPKVSGLRFGRMFGRTQHTPPPDESERVVRKLVRLGLCMNDPATYCNRPVDKGEDRSDIPAGYTYLGQFIAHEITFDSTGDLLVPDLRPDNLRTPQIDLDSLYGGGSGPEGYPELYEDDKVHLRIGKTSFAHRLNQSLPNDLPRRAEGKNLRKAILGDPRNDENLALAQTHVAFITFHNKVADDVKSKNPGLAPSRVFELAREQVIRHYQWVILHDFLPKLVDRDVLDCVVRHGPRWFRLDAEDGPFMPLEFSAAAFRIGHSMVRAAYEWNPYNRTEKNGRAPAPLSELFSQAGFIPGEFDGLEKDKLASDWIIDWRHFYDFGPLAPGVLPVATHNVSAKLDTVFNLRLDKVTGFPDAQLDQMQKAITVRNLLRGFYLGLPTGEEVAERIGETPLKRREIASGPHEELLDDPVFWGKTPLWYYVLKEAELRGIGSDGKGGHRLGPVGSRIVAETLVNLIRKSDYSILGGAPWSPAYGRDGVFEMIDLLKYADVVDPVAKLLRRTSYYVDYQPQ